MKTKRPHKQLVLVGGGHSHVTVIKRFAMQPVSGLKVTLVTPSLKTPYSGMLPGYVAGHYGEAEIYIDLAKLCFQGGIDWILTGARGLDLERQIVMLEGRPDLHYDFLSLDVGITPDLSDLQWGAGEVTPVKPIASFLNRLSQLRAQLASNQRVLIVGGGAASVELVMALAEWATSSRREILQSVRFGLVCGDQELLREAPSRTRRVVLQALSNYGVEVTTGARIIGFSDGILTTDQGMKIQADHVIWSTGATPMPWLKGSGLHCDEKGYVKVGPTLQSVSHANVFAVGDTAHMVASPRPKAGVYAVRQGPYLSHNLNAIALGQSLKRFQPQSKHLALIALGRQRAVGYRNGITVSGDWVWRLKNKIDQQFLAQFNDWQSRLMIQQDASDDAMRCLGCGSKVPASRLHGTLDGIDADLTQDDAQVLMTSEDMVWFQTVDHIRPLVPDLYLLGRIGLNHAASDVYAMGGEVVQVLSSLCVEESEGRVADNLFAQVVGGAFDQAAILDAPIRGGHSSEGLESLVGFAVTGKVPKTQLRSKQGVRLGDQLILTKALGIGVIFASLMQGRSNPDWLEGAIESMLRSNRQAAQLAQHYPVSAMTDVTGFGLAGHLSEMLRGDVLGARLYLSELPCLPGSLEIFGQTTIESSLAPHNEALVANMLHVDDPALVNHARYRLLFDPQTSGGLLLSLPTASAEALLDEFNALGDAEAWCVGEICNGYGLHISLSAPS